MIVDDMKAANPRFAALIQGAQVLRVPFEVCPFTDQPDGQWGVWWREWNVELERLVPRTESGAISCEWWRPAFNKMVIVSERREAGCLVYYGAKTSPGHKWGGRLFLIGIRGADLVVQSALQLMEKDGLVAGTFRHLPGHGSTMCGDTAIQIEVARYLAGLEMLSQDSTIAAAYDLDQKTSHMRWSQVLDATNAVCTFSMCMSLLSCKNIKSEVCDPAPKLQKRRLERGMLPLVSWHTLKVMGSTRNGPKAANGESMALHWVRGHFKDYRENGLFGSQKGVYWWSPHLAGQADRVVLKDYVL